MLNKIKDKIKNYNYIFNVDYNKTQKDILIDIINSLPGIKVSCVSNDINSINIFFRSLDMKGLFFITRCADNRYGGYPWTFNLRVGDKYEHDYDYPIVFCLSCDLSIHNGESIDNEIEKLITNMTEHLNHIEFMKEYDLSINYFKTITFREIKLNRILK